MSNIGPWVDLKLLLEMWCCACKTMDNAGLDVTKVAWNSLYTLEQKYKLLVFIDYKLHLYDTYNLKSSNHNLLFGHSMTVN